ncbi:hypothetical protein BaRGS_00032581 [Batillaria attramentaria]|uniref:Uncharacterized protein n=1 Tax=Batillaria attramentaria TaxID=370345 RepID=A0ABD0JMN1_9CAEN
MEINSDQESTKDSHSSDSDLRRHLFTFKFQEHPGHLKAKPQVSFNFSISGLILMADQIVQMHWKVETLWKMVGVNDPKVSASKIKCYPLSEKSSLQ